MTHRNLVDQHEFVLWRYDDDSVDIQCVRAEGETLEELAYLEACVLSRSLGEEIQGADEIFCIRGYSSGSATTQWRGESGELGGWARFKWLKISLSQATYGSLVPLQEPPSFLQKFLRALEYAAAKLQTRWGSSTPEPKSSPVENPAPAEILSADQLPENVVLFTPRPKNR